MARFLDLESFDKPSRTSGTGAPDEAELADERLQSYEQGYAAGWDDAVGAQSADMARLRTELGRNLTEMSLTFQEARQHVMASLGPLLTEMVAKVLPQTAHQSLAHVVLEQLIPLAEALSASPIEVRTAPVNVDTIARLLAERGDLPTKVTADETLGEGQAFLSSGRQDILIDFDSTVAAIGDAVAAFLDTRRTGSQI
jgi:flagellar assembly protein FliH